jgi:hypothetical protein
MAGSLFATVRFVSSGASNSQFQKLVVLRITTLGNALGDRHQLGGGKYPVEPRGKERHGVFGTVELLQHIEISLLQNFPARAPPGRWRVRLGFLCFTAGRSEAT